MRDAPDHLEPLTAEQAAQLARLEAELGGPLDRALAGPAPADPSAFERRVLAAMVAAHGVAAPDRPAVVGRIGRGGASGRSVSWWAVGPALGGALAAALTLAVVVVLLGRGGLSDAGNAPGLAVATVDETPATLERALAAWDSAAQRAADRRTPIDRQLELLDVDLSLAAVLDAEGHALMEPWADDLTDEPFDPFAPTYF